MGIKKMVVIGEWEGGRERALPMQPHALQAHFEMYMPVLIFRS